MYQIEVTNVLILIGCSIFQGLIQRGGGRGVNAELPQHISKFQKYRLNLPGKCLKLGHFPGKFRV